MVSAVVEENGWVLAVTGAWGASDFVDFALDPDGALPGVEVTTIGTGFRRSGGQVVPDSAATRTVVATKPLRLPWRAGDSVGSGFVGTLGETDNGDGTRTVRLALSEWVHDSETVHVTFRPGWRLGETGGTLSDIENNSTRSYPLPVSRWIQPTFAPPEMYRHPTDPHKYWVERPVAAHYPKGTEAVAGVRFVAYDGTHAPKELWVLGQATSPLFGDNLRVWGGYIDLEGLDPGFVTVQAEIYPWLGAVRKSGEGHSTDASAGFGKEADVPLHLAYDPDHTIWPEKFVAVDAVNGSTTYGDVTIGDSWALAKAGTPAADVTTAIRALDQKLKYTRPANNGFAAQTRSVEYMRVGLKAGVQVMGGTKGSSGIGANAGHYVVMGDPDEENPVASCVLQSGPANPGRVYALRAWLENLGMSVGAYQVFRTIDAGARLHLHNIVLRADPEAESYSTLPFTAGNSTAVPSMSATQFDYDYPAGLAGGGITFSFFRASRSTNSWPACAHITCERPSGGGSSFSKLSTAADQMLWNCRANNMKSGLGITSYASGSGSGEDPYQLLRLAVVNLLAESTDDGTHRFFAVGEVSYSELVDCIFDGGVYVGNGINIHNSSAMTPKVDLHHRGNVFRNFVVGRWATKQDVFSGDGSLTGSWELLYGVGYSGVVHANNLEGGAWNDHHREFPGLSSIDRMGDGVAASAVAFLDFVDYRASVDAPSPGGDGNGDYHPAEGSPLVGKGTRATTDEYLDGTRRGAVFAAGVLPMEGGDPEPEPGPEEPEPVALTPTAGLLALSGSEASLTYRAGGTEPAPLLRTPASRILVLD